MAATLDCPSATTLDSLVDCISQQMPQHASNGYVAPTAAQRLDFRAAVARMLKGQCDFNLGDGLAGHMALRRFMDSAIKRDYCVLMETLDADGNGVVDRGWGTFITYDGAEREINHGAPHPKFSAASAGSTGDSFTERQAIRIFRDTASRSYLMCGARRSANSGSSTCQPSYAPADCAHNVDNMFHAAYEEMVAHYGSRDWTAIQWHGKAATTCTMDMYLSVGLNAKPTAGSKVLALKSAGEAERRDWSIATPTSFGCRLNATDNPQGRLLNGVEAGSVCITPAREASHRFLHVEQTIEIIGELDKTAASWAGAIRASFPIIPRP